MALHFRKKNQRISSDKMSIEAGLSLLTVLISAGFLGIIGIVAARSFQQVFDLRTRTNFRGSIDELNALVSAKIVDAIATYARGINQGNCAADSSVWASRSTQIESMLATVTSSASATSLKLVKSGNQLAPLPNGDSCTTRECTEAKAAISRCNLKSPLVEDNGLYLCFSIAVNTPTGATKKFAVTGPLFIELIARPANFLTGAPITLSSVNAQSNVGINYLQSLYWSQGSGGKAQHDMYRTQYYRQVR